MIGGETEVVQRLDPILAALAPGVGDIPRTVGRDKIDGSAEQGYLYCRNSVCSLWTRYHQSHFLRRNPPSIAVTLIEIFEVERGL